MTPEKEAEMFLCPRLIPVPEWNKYHAWPTLGGLRHLIFHAKTNGFDRVIKRCGKRVLIDSKAFFEYVDEQTRKAGAE